MSPFSSGTDAIKKPLVKPKEKEGESHQADLEEGLKHKGAVCKGHYGSTHTLAQLRDPLGHRI